MTTISDLQSPAFVVNRSLMRRNCKVVGKEAVRCGFSLRPHVKTHKTIEGAKIQIKEAIEAGANVTGFVASTIPEVRMLASFVQQEQNIRKIKALSILYGVPIAEFRLKALRKIGNKYPEVEIFLLVDHPEQVLFLHETFHEASMSKPFSVFMKVDTGYNRAGIPPDERGIALAKMIHDLTGVRLVGIYSHW